MELYKSEFTFGKGPINKFLLNCKNDRDKYLRLIEIIEKHDNSSVIVKTLFDNKKDIILKFGVEYLIHHEYDIAYMLRDMQNFIRYYCVFICNDSVLNIINNKHILSEYKICNYENKPISILIMSYYKLGNVLNYSWTKYNFHILINVLKQVSFAILHAYEKYGFIHKDLHAGNILLKPKKVCEINYGCKILLIDTYEAIIMDFEKSTIDNKNKIKLVYKDIQKLLVNICYNNINLSIICTAGNKLDKLYNPKLNLEITKYYDEIEQIINSITVI